MITRAAIEEQLERARQLGYLGDGPVSDHYEHARRQVEQLGELEGGVVVDLGSGGGVPGLVVPALLPSVELVLIDRQARRTAFLRSAVAALGLAARVEVLTGAAEELAHVEGLRGACAAVLARSFGPPPVVVECGGGFLAPDGVLVVTEPPESGRWTDAPLERFGLRLTETSSGGSRYAVLRRTGEWPADLPRPERVTRRRPLW